MAQYELNLRDYWWIIRKKKFIIVFSAAMLGLFSFIFAYSRKPVDVFRASVSLKYEQTGPASDRGGAYGYDSDVDLATHAELIKSYSTIELAAKRLGWIDPKISPEEVRNNQELMNTIRNLKGKIETEQEGYTMIINVFVTSSLGDPIKTTKDLADFTNALGHAYAVWDTENKREKFTRANQFLSKQLDEARLRAQRASWNIQQFREDNEFITLDGSILVAEITAARAEYERIQRNRKELQRLIGASKNDRTLLRVGSSDLLPGISSPIIGGLKQQLSALKADRDALLLTYTEGYPPVARIDSSMSIIEKNILTEMKALRDNLIREGIPQEEKLTYLEEEYKKLPQLAPQLGEKEQELRFAMEAYTSLEDKWQDIMLGEQQLVSELMVVRPAFTPAAPINVSTTKATTVVGVIIGLILGVVFAFVAETVDTSIGTIEDVEAFLETSVLGVIPFVKPEEAMQRIRKKRPDLDDDEILAMQARLVAQFDSQSTQAESYRALRTNLQFVGIEKETKTIVVTSSTAREGKTTVSTNLAIAMAQIGKRTLLMEADLRKPAVARVFGIDREPGLTEVMLGAADWHDAVRTLTDIMMGKMPVEEFLATPGMDNLNIMTCGKIPPNPSEISNSRQMSELINQMRAEYDVIILDTAPVLQATDTALLSSKVDGVVLVYQVGRIARASLKRAKAQLENVKAHVLGVVLNGLKAEASRDYSAYHYGGYYGYGAEEKTEGFFLFRGIKKLLRKIRGQGEAGVEVTEESEPEKKKSFFQRVSLRKTAISISILLMLSFTFWYWRSHGPARPEVRVEETAVKSEVLEVVEKKAPPKEELVEIHPEKGPAGLQEERPQADTSVSPQTPGAKQGAYRIHIASHKQKKEADSRVEQLRNAGFVSFARPIDLGEKGRWYRVYVGQFSSKEDAKVAADQFIRQGLMDYAKVYKAPQVRGKPTTPPSTVGQTAGFGRED
jgi:capsular exopolysaccharide synthesis family protein